MKLIFSKHIFTLTLLFAYFFIYANQARAATFQMQTGYYMGDGVDNHAITGVGFQPELILIKDDTSNGDLGVVWKSSAMSGETSSLLAEATADIASDAIQSLDSDGFTLGTNADVNGANVRFTWVAYRGSDCTSSGTFCVGSYTGNGINPHVITGVGFQPNLVAVKNTGAISGTYRTSSMPTDSSQLFSAGNEITDGTVFKTLDTTGFTVGDSNRVNSASTNYWFFAFKTTANAFTEGTFTGDGTDNRAITAPGFRPSYVWLKNANATTPARAEFNLTESNSDYSGGFSDIGNAVNQIQSLDATGFTVGSDAAANENTKTFYWVAFGGAASPAASGTYKMSVGSYTGNGTTQSLSSFGFAPDLVIVKNAAGATHAVFRTKLMRGDLTSYFANTAAHFAGGITSLDSDGFTVGADASVNSAATVYQYQAFGNAFNPEDNTGAADFMIGAYTGAAVDDRNILRMPFAPNFVAIKPNSPASGMWRTSAQTGDASVGFSGVAESADNIQALNSDGFQVGNSTRVNGGTTTVFYFFSFKASSTMVVGSYTGSGSAQDITSVGFSSNLLWVKSTLGANAVFRPSPLAGNSTLFFPASVAVADRITAILSNGFSVGGNQIETNTSSTVYRYAAWIANSVPATPTLNSPADTATGLSATPDLVTTGTDPESDYLRYKIELCTDLAMTTACQTFDQTSSQTGWTGQDAQTSTAYASGTQATYSVQTPLAYATTYYWRSYAIDPGGNNVFSSTQTPFSFTTLDVPDAPSDFSGTAASSTSITWSLTDNADNESGFLIQDTGGTTMCTVSSSSSGTGGTVTCTETGLTAGTSYTRKAVAYNAAGNSTASANSSATTDTVASSGTGDFTLDTISPADNSYTADERPVFKWKAVADSTEGIARYDFYDHNGDLSLIGIPPSGTENYETDKYIVRYENFADSDNNNNYISLQTKSSPTWNNEDSSGNTDGKLKEGAHNWQVKAVDNAGAERSANRTVYIDRSGPEVTGGFTYQDRKLVISGTVTDIRRQSKSDNPAASGPASVEVRIEKLGLFGTYSLYSLATVHLTEIYWTDDHTLITNNAEQRADKYANYSYTPTDSIPSGSYRAVVTGRDIAGNNGGAIQFGMKITTGVAVAVTEPEEPRSTPAPSASVSPREETAQIQQVSPIPVAAVKPLTKLTYKLSDLYWRLVSSLKSLASRIGHGFRFIANAVNSFIGRFTDHNYFAFLGRIFDSLGRATFGLRRNLAMTFDLWFNKEPTRITDIRIESVTADTAIVRWTTNHYTSNNKVNYGETLSYGKEVFAPNKERDHIVTLTGLKPDTKYVFEVMSQGKNYTYDSHYEFTTLSQ